MPRIPELDALRAIAASAILVFHLSPAAFPPGWTGVDLFFVLSGYLITTILISHPPSPRFVLSFYARRALRIWPIYYLGLVFLVLINRWLPRPYSLEALPYFLTYTQNAPLYWTSKLPAFNPAYDHTWTLAIEEQYYVLWPVVLTLGRRWLPLLCLGTAAVAYFGRYGFQLYFVWPIVLGPFPERVLLSRCDGFALGGLLAWLFRSPRVSRPARSWLLWLSLAVAGVYLGRGIAEGGPSFLGLPTPANPALTILMVELFFFGLVGLVLHHAGHAALAPLRWPWLCKIGVISYGIYLYHYPVYWALDGFGQKAIMLYDQPWTVRVLKVALTLAIAWVSWHVIERPFLKLKDRVPYRAKKDVPAPQTSGCPA
jgi:peptidoglycan/LPS O-acetylase OafA/YrhL